MNIKLKIYLFNIAIVLLLNPVKAQQNIYDELKSGNTEFNSFTLNLLLSDSYYGKVAISYMISYGLEKKDTLIIKSGKCTFHGLLSEPTFLYLNFLDMSPPFDHYPRPIVLSEGIHNLNIDTIGFKNQSIKNNINDSIFLTYRNTTKSLEKDIWETMRNNIKDSSTESLIRTNYLKDSLFRFRTQTIKAYADYWVAGYLLFNLKDDLPPTLLKELFLGLNNNIKSTIVGKEVDNAVRNQVGNTASDFQATTSKNESFQMDSITKASSLTMMFFWATWCKPCKVMIPVLNKLNDKYISKGLRMVAIADNDDEKAVWLTGIVSLKIDFMTHVLMGRNKEADIARLYAVQAIPVVVLIDNIGQIVYRQVANETEELEKFIDAYYLK